MRELGDAEFILRELGGAEFIFARTGYRGISFCENWVAQNLFLRIGCQPHTELLLGYFRIKGTIFDRSFECQ